jgi:hypothetical protein
MDAPSRSQRTCCLFGKPNMISPWMFFKLSAVDMTEVVGYWVRHQGWRGGRSPERGPLYGMVLCSIP